MNHRIVLLFVLAIVLTALGSRPLVGQATKTMSASFSNVNEIDMEIFTGNIKMTKSRQAGEVTIEVVHDLEDYAPEMKMRDGTLLIVDKNISEMNNWNKSSTWTMTIPNDISIKAITGSGSVTLERLSFTEGQMSTGSGSLLLTDIGGALTLRTGSGNVLVTRFDGALELVTGSGNVTADNSKGTFDATTGSGNITFKEYLQEGPASFTTGSGNCQVSMAGSIGHDLNLSSGSGNSILNLQGEKLSGTVVMQAGVREGNISAPFKFDKVEEIKERWGTTYRKTKVFDNTNIIVEVAAGSGRAVIKE